jgi:hypothetical protein
MAISSMSEPERVTPLLRLLGLSPGVMTQLHFYYPDPERQNILFVTEKSKGIIKLES